jgi:hypothetical protein
MALCRLGEGANVIGYYMYYGGSQPLGKTGRLGEPGMPLVSYDFQAPLQEYGKTNRSYYCLKRLHQFIYDFGQELAPMVPSLPEDRPEAADPTKLRYALRSKGSRGYLFFNNYQRYLDMPDRKNVQFEVTLADGFDFVHHKDKELVFPAEPITIPSKSLGVFPINMPIADANIVYATAQPLMRWQDEGVTRLVMVCLSGIKAQLCLRGVKEPVVQSGQIQREGNAWLVKPQRTGIIQLTTNTGVKVEILPISEQDSLNAWKIQIADRRHLAVCPAELWQSGDYLKLRSRQSGPVQLRVYPATEHVLMYEGKRIVPARQGAFSVYSLPTDPLPQVNVSSQPTTKIPESDKDCPFKSADAPPKAWRIKIGDIDWNAVSDVLVRFEYIGDTARLYLNGLLVADNFWCKADWEVGLKRWQKELAKPDAELVLVISPWKRDQKVFVQKRPEVTEDLTAELMKVRAFAEQTLTLDMVPAN